MSQNNSRENNRLNDASPITSPSGLDGWLKSNAPRDDDGLFFGFENFKRQSRSHGSVEPQKMGISPAMTGASSSALPPISTTRATYEPTNAELGIKPYRGWRLLLPYALLALAWGGYVLIAQSRGWL